MIFRKEESSSLHPLWRTSVSLLFFSLFQKATAQYTPGDLEPVDAATGLILSKGLVATLIAEAGSPVSGAASTTVAFHPSPDGAACMEDPDDTNPAGMRKYAYVSNSEVDGPNGGVGAIYFDSSHQVTDYEMLLTGRDLSCSGAPTWWDTYMSCEEGDDGQVWEVDPWKKNAPRETIVGNILKVETPSNSWFGGSTQYTGGAKYETAAYDRRDNKPARIYVTIHDNQGPLLRFTPDPQVLAAADTSKDYTNVLHGGANTETVFLLVDTTAKTFTWTENYDTAAANAAATYIDGEGLGRCDLFVKCFGKLHCLWVKIELS